MKKREYYLVTLKENDVYLNEVSLRNILEKLYPELAKMEEKRVDLIYSERIGTPMSESLKRKISCHKENTKRMYDKLQVPQFLIAYKTGDLSVKEIFTGKQLTSKYPAILGIKSVSKEKVIEYFKTTNYSEKICKFILAVNNFFLTDDHGKNQTIDLSEIEGYIEGEVNNIVIRGRFKGKIRIRNMF